MKHLLISRRAATLASLGLALLAGCATIEPVPAGPDPHQTAILSLMDECLAQQAQTASRLESQNVQLTAQQAQLDAISARIAEAAQRPPQAARPAAPPPVCVAPPHEPGKLVVGQLEKVWLPEIGIELSARVDTGAETSSLDARNIELFERNGSRWVRFEITDPKNGESLALERKLK
ncbi:MAG: ATP-dependent zinc protease, partial [Halioglobus sp.]|nr:ATP-dependent zinc protease [Halioglobus sp.]